MSMMTELKIVPDVGQDKKSLQHLRYRRWKDKVIQDPERHAKLKAQKSAWNGTDKYYETYYKKRFGISYQEVKNMLARQNGLCANLGCSKQIHLHIKKGDSIACVDHDHVGGSVRGLLCTRCNTTLGHAEANISAFLGLIDYLNKHRS